MQADFHLHVFDVGQKYVQVADILVKILRGRFGNVFFQVRLLHLAADQFLKLPHRRVFRILFEMAVFFQQLFQFGQFLIRSGHAHRRGKVTDQAGGAASFGLDSLSHARDPVGINIGQITQGNFRIAAIRHGDPFARQPFQRTMRSHVNDHIRLPDIPHPGIKADIVVRRRTVRRMINLAGILPEPPRRLNGNENIAIQHPGNQ